MAQHRSSLVDEFQIVRSFKFLDWSAKQAGTDVHTLSHPLGLHVRAPVQNVVQLIIIRSGNRQTPRMLAADNNVLLFEPQGFGLGTASRLPCLRGSILHLLPIMTQCQEIQGLLPPLWALWAYWLWACQIQARKKKRGEKKSM